MVFTLNWEQPDLNSRLKKETNQLEPQDPQRLDEQKLIVLCQEGDRVAFERLYRRYEKDVYTMAIRMVHSEEIAEEVTQEVFISVYKDIQKFQFQSAFTT